MGMALYSVKGLPVYAHVILSALWLIIIIISYFRDEYKLRFLLILVCYPKQWNLLILSFSESFKQRLDSWKPLVFCNRSRIGYEFKIEKIFHFK